MYADQSITLGICSGYPVDDTDNLLNRSTWKIVPENVKADFSTWFIERRYCLGYPFHRAGIAENIPGEIVECGVFKGVSLIRFAIFRELLQNQSKRIIGFDTLFCIRHFSKTINF